MTSSTLINIGLTLLVSTCLYFGAHFIAEYANAPELAELIRIFVFTAIVLIPFAQSNFAQQANLKFRGTFVSQIVRVGLFFLFVLVLFYRNKSEGTAISLTTLAWGQFFTAFIGSITAIYFGWPYFRFNRTLQINWFKTLLHFGIFTFGTSLSTFLYKSIDRIMLAKFMTTKDVAVFDPALRIAEIVEIPIQAAAAIVYPQMTRQIETEGESAIKELYEKSVGIVIGIILPFCITVLLFPAFFVMLLVGNNPVYDQSVAILQITILYTLFVPFGRQFGTTLDSIGKPRWSFFFVFTGAILNIISNYVFIMEYGTIGAAYGTLLTLALKFIAQQIILYRILNVHTLSVFKNTWSFYRQIIPMVMRIRKEGLSAIKNDAPKDSADIADTKDQR